MLASTRELRLCPTDRERRRVRRQLPPPEDFPLWTKLALTPFALACDVLGGWLAHLLALELDDDDDDGARLRRRRGEPDEEFLERQRLHDLRRGKRH